MKTKILPSLYSIVFSIFIVAGPVVFLINLLIYYSYLFFTISGLIFFTVIFTTLVSKFYDILTEDSTEKKYYLRNAIIMFAVLEIVLLVIYPRIF